MPEPFDQQIDQLEKIFFSDKDPTGRAFVPLADMHRRSGDLDRALEVLQEGLAAHPESASGHVVAGWLYRDRGEDDSATQAFERVLKLDTDNVVALRSLAESAEDAGRGLAYFERLVELEPGDPDVVAAIERLQAEVAGTEEISTREIALEEPAIEEAPPEVVPVQSLAPDDALPVDENDVSTRAEAALDEAVVEAVPPVDEVAAEAELATEEPVEEATAPADGPVEAATAPAEEPLEEATAAPEESVAEAVAPAPDVAEGDGEIYTQTLAELYAKQGAADKAAEVYRKLLEDDPENGMFLHRIAELTRGVDVGPVIEEPTVAAEEPTVAAEEPTVVADDRPVVPVESLAPDAEALVAETPVEAAQAALEEPPVAVDAVDEDRVAADDRVVVPIGSLAPDPEPIEASAPTPAVPVEDLAPDPDLEVEPPVATDDRPVIPIESLAPDGASGDEDDDPFPWMNRM